MNDTTTSFGQHCVWIGAAPDFPERRVPRFRKQFRVEGSVRQALWRVAAGGFVEVSINGRRINDHRQEPAFTDYCKTLLYVTCDVTAWLRPGLNTLDVLLADGWFNPRSEDTWEYHRAPWRGQPRFLAELEIQSEDRTCRVVSDESWEFAASAILESDLRVGETCDARECDSGDWRPVRRLASPGGELRPQELPPIRTVEEWDAVRIDSGADPERRVYDAGRNLSGFVRIRVRGRAGDRVRIVHAERLDAAGRADNGRINEFAIPGRGFQEDNYILKGGDAVEEWHPRFVYHGFRYIEIHAPADLEILTVTACWNHTGFAQTGGFACSHPLLNRVQELCTASFRSNFQALPIDCPHREKNGWTGDARIAVHCGLLNFDTVSSYRKWLDDCRDAMRPSGELPAIVPSPGWGFEWGNGPCWDAAYPYIVWQLYVHTADRMLLERHYEALNRYGDFLARTKRNADGLVDWGLADWVPPYGAPMEYTAPREFFSSAYAVLIWRLLGRIAATLGLGEDAERHRRRGEACRVAINRRYYHAGTGEYAHASQSAQAVALHLGLPEESERRHALAALVRLLERDHGAMNCGILGTESILHALSDAGEEYHRIALALATRTAYPSWGYMIAHGATTLWESWQGNSSLNHVLFSDISHWMIRTLAGIRPDEENPGFRHYFVRPQGVGELRFARATVPTPHGLIHVEWRRDGDKFTLSLTQPEGCAATVTLPDGSCHDARLPRMCFTSAAEPVPVTPRPMDVVVGH